VSTPVVHYPFFVYSIEVVNGTLMTITERNQKLYELRKRRDELKAQLAWVEQDIWLTNDQYKRQDLDLYTEMFGENN